jgi:hypothetical protein
MSGCAFPNTLGSMVARSRGRTTITSQRIIPAKFDTEKRFQIQVDFTKMFLLGLDREQLCLWGEEDELPPLTAAETSRQVG